MTDTVKVAVKGERKKEVSYKTVIKSYEIHPTTNPLQMVAPFNPSREKCWISPVDVTIVVTNDLPPQDQIPSQTVSGGICPQGAAALLASQGNGNNGYEFYGPDALYVVAIAGNTACRVNVSQLVRADA